MVHRMESGELQRRVGRNLRAYRERIGMSQEEFAHEVSGFHRTHQSAIERGQKNMSLGALESLARKLEIDPLELLQEPPEAGQKTAGD